MLHATPPNDRSPRKGIGSSETVSISWDISQFIYSREAISLSHAFACVRDRMLQRKEEEVVKRQTVERRALPKRIRAERKARDMMFRESLRISSNLDPDGEREKLKKVYNLLFESNCMQRPEQFAHLTGNICPSHTVPRAREEAILARAAAVRHQAYQAIGGDTCHSRGDDTVNGPTHISANVAATPSVSDFVEFAY